MNEQTNEATAHREDMGVGGGLKALERIATALEEIANMERDPYRITVYSQEYMNSADGRAEAARIYEDVECYGLNADYWAGFGTGYALGKADRGDSANNLQMERQA